MENSSKSTQQKYTRKWYVIDAANRPLGRTAAAVAAILRGKHTPKYRPNIDMGDNVIIINAEKAIMTGKKRKDKKYYRFTGYVGNLKETTYEKLLAKHPRRPMELAIKGMLPHNSLGRSQYRKLHVYEGPTHEHEAQKPEVWRN